MLLTRAQALHVNAIMALSDAVDAKVKIMFGDVADTGINVFTSGNEVHVVHVMRYDVMDSEIHESRAQFAKSYDI